MVIWIADFRQNQQYRVRGEAKLSGEDKVKFKGVVSAAKGNGHFVVKIDDGGAQVRCTLSGKMRTKNIKVVEGDRVDIETSVYDLTNGRIMYRHR
jgi:translation initiation factor IF-1